MTSIDKSYDAFDYSHCDFELRLVKKEFLGEKVKYVYIMQNQMVFCKEPQQSRPERIIFLEPGWQVKWLYEVNKEQKSFDQKVIGFRILTNTDQKIEFYGEPMVLIKLKSYFNKQMFSINFLKDFELIKKIGKGKYAKVYKVKDKDTQQYYAVKYLHKAKLNTIEDGETALYNELRILRQLDHPNLLQFISAYIDDQGYYILSELLDSEKTLQQEITKVDKQAFSLPQIRSIMKQLIEGLQYCHSKGIMHRDLKPQNIMFTENAQDFHIKIIDFGLAQYVKEKKFIYVHVGTPGYVAPEILANESEDHRYNEKCDMFSVGVIFHILLTGRPLFPGKKFSQVLEKNKQCKIVLSGEPYDKLDTNAMDLMYRLLHQDPQLRITSTKALQHKFFSDSNEDFSPLTKNGPLNLTLLQGKQQNRMIMQPQIQTKFMHIPYTQEEIATIISTLPKPGKLQKGNKEQLKNFYKILRQFIEIFAQIQEYEETNDYGFCASPVKLKGQDSPLKAQTNKPTMALKQEVSGSLIRPIRVEMQSQSEDQETLKNELELRPTKSQEQASPIVVTKQIPNSSTNQEEEKIDHGKIQLDQLKLDQNLVEDNSNTGGKKLIPPAAQNLVQYFPNEVFGTYINTQSTSSPLQIQKTNSSGQVNDEDELKRVIYKLGLFLLFGLDFLSISQNHNDIEQQIVKVNNEKIYGSWLVDLIKLMVKENERQRIDFIGLRNIFNDQCKELKEK